MLPGFFSDPSSGFVEKRGEDARMLGARRAGIAMYSNVHEDSEHRATTQAGTAVVFQQTHRVE